ncbi:MAG: paraslipin, partial [Moorea sp. SIO3G5]|nr:paraslipin [Moorena sp. SIO3G5]
IVYWQILDMYKAFYAVDNVHEAIENLVMTTLRSTIGQLELDETYASRDRINQNLLQQLDDASADWGVKVMRVEVQEIKPPQTIIDALEKERAAKSEKQAKILQAEGTVESIQMISKALEEESNTQKVLQFLIAQRYVEANEKLGESSNSKVVFMDPKALSEAMTDLLQTESAGQSN